MKKIFFVVFWGAFIGSGLMAQDTIPFWDSSICYQIVRGYYSPDEIPQDSLQHLSSYTGMCNGAPGWDTSIYFKHRIPIGTNIYGIAVTSPNTELLPGVSGELITYNNSSNRLNFYGSINSDRNLYCKQMWYDYNNNPNHSPADTRAVRCNIYLFNEKVSISDTILYLRIINQNEDYFLYTFYYSGAFLWVTCPVASGEANFFGGTMFPLRKLPCPAPRMVRMGNNYSGRVDFHWNPGGDTALYQLAFHSADDGSLMFETDTLTDTTFSLVDSIAPAEMVNGRYEVRVRKACDYLDSPYHTLAWSEWSEPRVFYYMHRIQGIGEVEEAVQFTLSPNPAKGTVTVEVAEGAEQVEIVDMEGRVVYTQTLSHPATQSLTLDISHLTKGVYLVRLGTPQGVAARRLVVK